MTAHSRKPMTTAAGYLSAPPGEVADLVLGVPAEAGEADNLILRTHGTESVTGGPDHFKVTYPGGRLTVDVDRERGTIAAQGGWWYRGEYTVSGAEGGGTILTLRVYNVAKPLSRWAVPLANRFFRGFEEQTRESLRGTVGDLGGRLGCESRLIEDH